MNPYNRSSSGGGLHMIEGTTTNQTLTDQFFNNGTYNLVGLGSYTFLNGSNNYGYGTNIFAQSGHVYGFAIGGMFEATNPFLQPGYRYLSGNGNGVHFPYSYANLPNSQVVSLAEAYLEYQLPDSIQLDVGRIFLDNPWMNSYDDSFMTSATFQGAVANYQLNNAFRLSAIATNAYQEFSSNGFNSQSVYNRQYNGNGFQLGPTITETHSYALGGLYNPNENYQANLWAYNFGNYVNMLYADSNYNIQLNDTNKLTFAAQAGNQNTLGMGANVMQQSGYGSPSSYLFGAKLGYHYSDWLDAFFAYDGMYGPENAFYQGGFVSPYTYGIVNDPLYTSGLAGGLIEQGAGGSYKIATVFRPIGEDLKIETAYERFNTASPLDSYDLDVKYKPFNNNLKGLILHLWVNYTSPDFVIF